MRLDEVIGDSNLRLGIENLRERLMPMQINNSNEDRSGNISKNENLEKLLELMHMQQIFYDIVKFAWGSALGRSGMDYSPIANTLFSNVSNGTGLPLASINFQSPVTPIS
jgi:hypothetical protein